jgi:hypothetical protein
LTLEGKLVRLSLPAITKLTSKAEAHPSGAPSAIFHSRALKFWTKVEKLDTDKPTRWVS